MSVLMTRKEAATYLGYELRTFERRVQEQIAWIRVGRLLHTTREELDRWRDGSGSSPLTSLGPPCGGASVVYFIQFGNDGPIKIGRTDDVDRRLAGLQTAAWAELRIIAYISGTLSVESELHREFAGLRIRGEWFRPDVALLDRVREIRRAMPTEALLTREQLTARLIRRLDAMTEARK